MPRDLLAERPPRDLLVPERKGLFTTREESGNVHLGGYAGDLLNSVKRTLSLPGEVYRGDVQVYGPDGRTSQELIERGAEAGAVMSPVPAPVRAGSRAIEGVARAMRKQAANVPTAEELRAAGSAGYNAARDMGVDFKSRAVADMASTLRAKLEGDGILDVLAPKSYRILQMLERPPEGSVAPLAGLDAARKALRNAAQDFANPTEQLAASRIIRELDRFTENPAATSVVAGPAAAAGKALAEARGNYAASMRSDKLTGVADAADLRAAAANSGRNADNAIRSRIASLLLNKKARAGYSPEEVAAIERISMGSFGRNRVRDVGNLFGGGGGLGQMLTTGAGAIPGMAAGSPTLAGMGAVAAPAIGIGAKTAANALTRRALSHADELVRRRSPLYQARANVAPMVPVSPAAREAVLKALLLQMQGSNAGERDRMMGGAL